ncbi:TMhelix containing protein [Vibrio phage 1.287.O._10N.286.55.C7]|nr:TMhelix containing protein [Vibrio phage 1.287.O._10N.286.55.C7]
MSKDKIECILLIIIELVLTVFMISEFGVFHTVLIAGLVAVSIKLSLIAKRDNHHSN